MMMTGLSVRGLTATLKGRTTPLLEDVSFSAPEAAVTAILGASGAGKTSLLAAIAGLLPATRGGVFVAGKDVAGRPAARRGIAFLAPGTSLDAGRAVSEAVRRVSSRGRRQAAAAALAALAPVDDRWGARIAGTLSHGEGFLALTAARLGAATGDTLLLDEAGTGLDAGGRERLAALCRDLAAAGRTVLIATREAAVALAADQLVLLHDGRVLQAGTPASVYAEPRCALAARLTGPANILSGTVRELRPGGFLWSGGGRFAHAVDPETTRPPLGTALALCLRPERIVLLRPGEVAENVLAAEVRDVRSAGALLDVQMETPAGPLLARVPSWQPAVYPVAGQRLSAGWAADASAILEATT